jgi:uncharacterized pyridoxamine 5'-phosphate oxidase family protein
LLKYGLTAISLFNRSGYSPINAKGEMKMSPTALSFEQLRSQVAGLLEKNHLGFLATSEGCFVTVRQMILFSHGLTTWFFTGVQSRKYRQIAANPNVAIAFGNVQIEGIACVKGRTSDKQNAWFLKEFEALSPERYDRVSRKIVEDPGTIARLIQVDPVRIALYTDAYLDVLYVNEQRAARYGHLEEMPLPAAS